MRFIICYDITDDSLRAKIVKILEDYGERIQYSVFEFSVTELIFRRIMDSVNQIINSKEDSILVYEMCEADWTKRMFLGVRKDEENIYEKNYAIV